MNCKTCFLFIVLIASSFVVMCGGCSNAQYDKGLELETYSQATLIRGVPPICQSEKYECSRLQGVGFVTAQRVLSRRTLYRDQWIGGTFRYTDPAVV